jgi:hypothetical protein
MSEENESVGMPEGESVEVFPNFEDPEVAALFAKIDAFLDDPSTGVRKEIPERRIKADLGHEAGEGGCEDPQCIGGTLMLNLNNQEDFVKAVGIAESQIMGSAMGAHRALRAGDVEGADRLLDSLISDAKSFDTSLLQAVAVSIADAAAGMYLRIQELEGEEGSDGSGTD